MPDSPPKQRFRFSLLNLLLLLTAMSTGGAGYLIWRGNVQLKQENALLHVQNLELRKRYGEFTVDDPSKIYAVSLRERFPTPGNPWQWRWRVYLPQGKTHQLSFYNGLIPKSGVPKATGVPPVVLPMRAGENYVAFSIYHDGYEWRETLTVNGSGSDGPFRNQPWMTWANGRATPSKTLSYRHSSPTQLDAGYELVRFRAYSVDLPPVAGGQVPEAPDTAAPGFLSWIDSN